MANGKTNRENVKELSLLNVTFKNNNELKELLGLLGFIIDEGGFVKDKSGDFVRNSSGSQMYYKNISSILPGSKVIIEKNDFTAVSRYFNDKIVG